MGVADSGPPMASDVAVDVDVDPRAIFRIRE
jgi:hypothetical protein